MYQNIHWDRSSNTITLWDDEKGVLEFPYEKYAYAKHKDGTFRSMYGDPLKKIRFWKKDTELELFESDVSPTTRVLVDMYTDSDIPSTGHTVLFFDIEVEVTHGLPDWKNPINKITSIAMYDDQSEDYIVFVLDEEGRLEDTTKDHVTVISCDTERTLLERFLNQWESISPTIITGWNIDGFDIPYLYSRLQYVLGEEANRLSPIGQVHYAERRNRFFIAGVSSLDYMMLYKKFSYTQKASYALNSVGKDELGLGKVEYEGTLDELFEEDLETFIDYNVRDVEIVVKLDQKFQYIELVRGICHAGHVPYEDIVYSSRYLDGAILTFLKRRGVVAPNKPERNAETNRVLQSDEEQFEGAYVKPPKPGRYEWLYDLDLTSLYPSIIMSLNISPETKVARVSNWDTNTFLANKEKTWYINHKPFTTPELKKLIGDHNLSIASNGVLYSTDSPGVLPSILSEWFEKRVEYKDLMKKYGNEGDQAQYEFYDKRQLVQKILLNSLYGVLGLSIFRFYDLDNAEAVTLTGQKIIKFTEKCGNKYYNEILGTNDDYCIYVDTDSVFFPGLPILKHRYGSLGGYEDAQISEMVFDVASELQTYINGEYDRLCKYLFNIEKHRFEIKRELVSKSGIWIAKKRYAQWVVYNNGVTVNKLDVKGIDVVRSTFAPSFKKLMKDVLSMILHHAPQDKIDDRILTFKKDLYRLDVIDVAKASAVKKLRKWDPNETWEFKNESPIYNRKLKIGIRKKGTPAHVKAAIAYNELLNHWNVSTKYSLIRSGEKIRWVYLKNNPFGLDTIAMRTDETPEEIVEFARKYVDRDKLFERELESKLLDFYNALGWQFPSEHEAMASQFFEF